MPKLLSAFGCICLGIIGILLFIFGTKVMGLILPGNGFINILLVTFIIFLIVIALDRDPKKGE